MGRSEANARRGSTPVALGLAAALASGSLVLLDRFDDPPAPGVLTLIAGLGAMAAGLLFARGASEAGAGGRPRFAAAVAERVADGVLLGSLVWVAIDPRGGIEADVALAGAALSALGLSYLAAYTRAKGRGLGFTTSGWPAEPMVHFGLVGVALPLRAGGFDAASAAVLWLAAAASAVSVLRSAGAIGGQEEPS
jgi:hypothetical protein